MVDIQDDVAPKTQTRRMGPGRPRKTTTSAKKTVQNYTDTELADKLTELLLFASMGVGLADKPCATKTLVHPEHESCSVAVANNAPMVAVALVEASKSNAALRRALSLLVTGSVFSQLISSLLPIAFVVARNHVSALQIDDPVEPKPESTDVSFESVWTRTG